MKLQVINSILLFKLFFIETLIHVHYCKYDAGVYMSHTPAPTLVLPLLHNHDCAIIATRR